MVVVDLPGNVNVHRAPLPWFLEQKRATWSERRLSGGKKNNPSISPELSADFGCRSFLFHETRGLCPLQGPSLSCSPGPGPEEAPPWAGGTSPSTRARAGGNSSENQPRAGPPRLPRMTWQNPNPTLCLLCLSFFWRQLAGLVERSPAEQMWPGYIMQIGCSEELISEYL